VSSTEQYRVDRYAACLVSIQHCAACGICRRIPVVFSEVDY
jgi:hypothetical protein